MKYSYNWLKKLSGTKKTPEQLAELLTMKAFEVEGIEKMENKLSGVVAGKISAIQKHPNADKLQLVSVDIGGKKLNIVCGASNIKIGNIVPVALVGAKLPNNKEIREAEIRGVKSFGMLCAEDELGIGKNHSGILILGKKCKIGTPIVKELDLDDTIMEIKVLPDRGHDALSYIGMAREIAAMDGINFKYNFKKLYKSSSRKIKISIENKKLCQRYVGAILKGVEIKESPIWIRMLLRKSGINPINNIVDATNYVMFETGQPLHAFDFEKVKNGEIIVRLAKKGEKIKLLDETERILFKEDLVIADSEKALAIAGVMGGMESGISENTKKIVIEAASFDCVNVRKTRLRHNLSTDAAIRFEKEIDPNLAELAMARVLEIIGISNRKTLEIKDIYPIKASPWKIKLDLCYVKKLLGENISVGNIVRILNLLDLKLSGKGNIVNVKIPTFRIDLKTQEDLIEEIGRIYGYEKIKSQAPKVNLKTAEVNSQRLFERKAKEILAGIGFSEIYNYSFCSEQDVKKIHLNVVKHLRLENPLNSDQVFLRASLVPGILKNVRENLKYFKNFRIFENGRIYKKSNEVLPNERKMLTGAIVLENQKEGIFYEAKGCSELLMNNLGIENYCFESIKEVDSFWHVGRSAEIKINQKTIGRVGEINPQVLKDFGVSKRVACFEFDLRVLQKNTILVKTYKTISKYPTVIRDVSVVSQSRIKADDILKNIKKNGGTLVRDVELFDIFQKENKNSFAYHIKFGAGRTLENQEVDNLMQKIISALEKDLGVEIRK